MAATLVLAVAKMVSFGTSPIPSISHAGSHLATWNTWHSHCIWLWFYSSFVLRLIWFMINDNLLIVIWYMIYEWYDSDIIKWYMIWYDSWTSHELWLFISDMIGPAGRALADMMILRWWILNLYSGLWPGVVLGCELLRGQGFPEGLLVSGSVEIDSEAGESKTVDVPPVSASWLCVVWNAVFFPVAVKPCYTQLETLNWIP